MLAHTLEYMPLTQLRSTARRWPPNIARLLKLLLPWYPSSLWTATRNPTSAFAQNKA